MVEPGGGSGYAAILKCAEFSVYLGRQTSRPTFWVQLRADFIYTVGIRGAIDASLGVVSELSESALTAGTVAERIARNVGVKARGSDNSSACSG